MLLSLLLLLMPPAAAAGSDLDSRTTLRIGLAYGSGALATANLENADGHGSGYSFGYYDSSLNFVELGYTSVTTISMLKTHNIYLTSTNTYTTTASNYGAVGCYHIQLPGSYSTFESAQAAADSVGGFVAWISGTYYVRLNSYVSRSQAQAAADELPDATVGETTKYGIAVVKTGTNTILFQFDDEGSGTGLGVEPDLTGAADRQTWFKGYKYRGGFRYQRINGGDLTVVNIVALGDYVKGVVPYEMSPSWPLEALKAQAVCARTYALSNLNKHKSYGFDLCNSTECQVYYGTNQENSTTIASVEETSGVTVKYNGTYATTFFSSSDGGATEASKNVWGGDLPYLQGVIDPYEAYLADKIPSYNWSVTLTGAEIQAKLVARGNTNCGVITAVSIEKTETGNVYSMTFTDTNGKNITIYRETCRTLFGFRSQRFDLAGGTSSGGNSSTGSLYVNGELVDSASGLYVASGSGKTQLGDSYYIITSSGTQAVSGSSSGSGQGATSTATGTTFTFQGSGYGHNVGMSQWGANAMAQQGFGYVDILTFYFTGVTVGI